MFHVLNDENKISVAVNNNFADTKAFKEDAGTIALKAGIAVTMDTTSGKVRPAKNDDLVVLGWLYADAVGDIYNCPAYASGMVGVYYGKIVADTDVCEAAVLTAKPGTPLYLAADGKLTTTQGKTVVGSVIGNSSVNEDIEAGLVRVALQTVMGGAVSE